MILNGRRLITLLLLASTAGQVVRMTRERLRLDESLKATAVKQLFMRWD